MLKTCSMMKRFLVFMTSTGKKVLIFPAIVSRLTPSNLVDDAECLSKFSVHKHTSELSSNSWSLLKSTELYIWGNFHSSKNKIFFVFCFPWNPLEEDKPQGMCNNTCMCQFTSDHLRFHSGCQCLRSALL